MDALRTCGFETIRNNTALKLMRSVIFVVDGFETIRNNTALKQALNIKPEYLRFETIRNNTALKHRYQTETPK